MTSYESKQRWRNKVKQRIVYYAGGCCQCCGYKAYIGNLSFHHVDQNQKKDMVHQLIRDSRSWKIIIREVDKCVLVCHNCHGEIHAGIRPCPAIDHGDRVKRLIEIHSWEPLPLKYKQVCCKVCKAAISGGNRKFCSQACVHRAQEKIIWPNDLHKLVEESSRRAVAKRLGVSDKAVAKRLLQFQK